MPLQKRQISGREVLAALADKLDPHRPQPNLPQELASELGIAADDVPKFMNLFRDLLEAAQAVTRHPNSKRHTGKWTPEQFAGSGIADITFTTC